MRDFQSPGRSLVYAANGLCATSHPLAAQAAVRMLQDGGNAVDAAIAAAVLLGLAEPPMCGIGGDCFVLVKPPGEERLLGLNGSGRAPAGFDAGALRAAGLAQMPPKSAHAVTVPGAVDAFARLSADWGRLGLAASLAPAIRYADEGVPVAPRVAWDWSRHAGLCKATRGGFSWPAGRRRRRANGSAPPARPRCCGGSPATGATASMPARWPRTWWHRCARSAAPTRSTISPPPPAATSSRSPATTAARAGRAAAERPGRDRDPAGEDPRPLRPRAPRPLRRRPGAPRGGGDQARLRRPRPLRRRPRGGAAAARTHAGRRHRRRAGGADRPGPGPARSRRRGRGGPPRDRLPLRRRPRADGGVADLLDLPRLRLGARIGPLRDQLPQPRRRFHPDAGASQRGGRRQAADAHHHPGDAPPRRAAADAVRGDGRRLPADRPRRASSPTWSTSASTRRRRSTRRARSPTRASWSSRPATGRASRRSWPRSATGSTRRQRAAGRRAGDRDRRTTC